MGSRLYYNLMITTDKHNTSTSSTVSELRNKKILSPVFKYSFPLPEFSRTTSLVIQGSMKIII